MTMSIDELRDIRCTEPHERTLNAAKEYLEIREAFGPDVDLLALAKALKAGKVAVVRVKDGLIVGVYAPALPELLAQIEG